MQYGSDLGGLVFPSQNPRPNVVEKLVEYRCAHYAAHSEAATYTTNTPARVQFRFSNPILCELRSGMKVMRIGGADPFEVRPGDAVFVPAGLEIDVDLGSASFHQPVECDCVEIEASRFESILGRLNERAPGNERDGTFGINWSAFAVLREPEARNLDLPSLMRLFRMERDVFMDHRIDARIEDTLLGLLQARAHDLLLVAAKAPDNGIHAAIRLIRESLHRHVSVDELARVACMSVSSLHRNFQRQFGTTPARLANDYRVAEAKKMLREGDERTEALAFRLGFSDASHFSRTFRKMTGESPLEYRKSRRHKPCSPVW